MKLRLETKCCIPGCNNVVEIDKNHFEGKLDVCESCRSSRERNNRGDEE